MIPRSPEPLPFVTTVQMIEVDRAMIDDYRIELIQMMENAGRCLAELARQRFLEGDPVGRRVLVLAGRGGNGGGALVSARRLHNAGAQVEVRLSAPAGALAGVAGHQLDILRRMGVAIEEGKPGRPAAADLILDGLIGYSLAGAPRGAAAALISWANDSGQPILALDVPSGLDAGTGQVYEPAVRAAATMTLALPKAGLRMPAARAVVGELYLADISVPPALYAGPGLELDVGPIFAAGDLLRVW